MVCIIMPVISSPIVGDYYLILRMFESHRSHSQHFLLPHICNGISIGPKLDRLSQTHLEAAEGSTVEFVTIL